MTGPAGSEPAGPRRRYRSRRREEGAQETRERILEAARLLFLERGFAGATVAAIAEAAGTAQETVYQAFGNKRALLGELVRRAVRGDDPAPVLDQPGPRAVAVESDPAEALGLFARDVAGRLERAGELMRILADAGRADPELAALYRELHAARLRNMRVLVEGLGRSSTLRLGGRDAAETVWALASPELHALLLRTAGWSQRRYTAWLADSLTTLLLAVPDGGTGARAPGSA